MGYSVVIVDDEKNICSLIKNEIDWDALNLTLIGTYNNSEEALDQICILKPDIIITDIQMPGISGLELIEKIKDSGIDSNYIIISGYSYFDYAKQAVKFGVENYILKPIDHKELNESLERICHKLNRSSIDSDNLLKEKMDTVSLRDYFVSNTSVAADLSIDEINSIYKFNFKPGIFYVGLIRIDKHSLIEQAPITAARIHGSLSRNISGCCHDFHIVSKNQFSYIGLFNCNEDNSEALVRGFQYVIDEGNNEYLLGQDAAITIGVSEKYSALEDRTEFLNQASALCDARLVFGNNRVYEYESFPRETYDYSSYMAELGNTLKKCLALSDKELFCNSCASFMKDAYEIIKTYPLSVFSFSRMMQKTLDDVLNSHGETELQVEVFENYDSFIDGMVSLAAKRYDGYELNFISKERKIVIEIKEYITSHLADKLDLDALSKIFFLSPAYLGQLFKSETGTNITAYINTERIEYAKALLLQNQYSIGDVASMIGYNDQKYFTRMFKKNTGISPMEYRKIHRMF